MRSFIDKCYDGIIASIADPRYQLHNIDEKLLKKMLYVVSEPNEHQSHVAFLLTAHIFDGHVPTHSNEFAMNTIMTALNNDRQILPDYIYERIKEWSLQCSQDKLIENFVHCIRWGNTKAILELGYILVSGKVDNFTKDDEKWREILYSSLTESLAKDPADSMRFYCLIYYALSLCYSYGDKNFFSTMEVLEYAMHSENWLDDHTRVFRKIMANHKELTPATIKKINDHLTVLDSAILENSSSFSR